MPLSPHVVEDILNHIKTRAGQGSAGPGTERAMHLVEWVRKFGDDSATLIEKIPIDEGNVARELTQEGGPPCWKISGAPTLHASAYNWSTDNHVFVPRLREVLSAARQFLDGKQVNPLLVCLPPAPSAHDCAFAVPTGIPANASRALAHACCVVAAIEKYLLGVNELLAEMTAAKMGSISVLVEEAVPLTQDAALRRLADAHDAADLNRRPDVWSFRHIIKLLCAKADSGVSVDKIVVAWDKMNQNTQARALGKGATMRMKRMTNDREFSPLAASFGEACTETMDANDCRMLLTISFFDQPPTFIGGAEVKGPSLLAVLTKTTRRGQELTFEVLYLITCSGDAAGISDKTTVCAEIRFRAVVFSNCAERIIPKLGLLEEATQEIY